MERTREQKALFMALKDDLRLPLRGGHLTLDQAIETLQDHVAHLERLRDRGVDPKNAIV